MSEQLITNVSSTLNGNYYVKLHGSGGTLRIFGDSQGEIANLSQGQSVSFSCSNELVYFIPSATPTKIQLEQKSYITSWVDVSRSAETLKVATNGIFNKNNWSIELLYIPKLNDKSIKKAVLWSCYIDANNYYELRKNITTGYLSLVVVSGGISKSITENTELAVGSTYKIYANGDGTHIKLGVNNSKIGSDTDYTEPVGSLPTYMYFGSDSSGANQCNGYIDDVCVCASRDESSLLTRSNRSTPLTVDEYTTYKLNFDDNLNVGAGGYRIKQVTLQLDGLAKTSSITYTSSTPTNTTFSLQTSLDGTTYTNQSIGAINEISDGTDLSAKDLYLREVFTTSNNSSVSSLSDLTINIDRKLLVANNGDIDIFPEIEIVKSGAGSVQLINLSNNNQTFTLSNLLNGEIVYLYGETEEITSDQEPTNYRYGDFSGNFISLIRGSNYIQIIGDCTVYFRYQGKLLAS